MICRRGCVYLVGAGPGDPELITVRGVRLLQQADTVIHDRLIPVEVLSWCRPNTHLIDVGKYPDHHRISQSEINDRLVNHARRGEIVVRLKGGDPFVFGRGTEEIEACRAAGIPYHIVPGVSSAIAGPASVGIPVTSRGVARSFAVVTGQTAVDLNGPGLDFNALARTDTVVLMMACKNLRQLTRSLILAGRNPETPAACIERATYSDQRATYATLAKIADQAQQLKMSNPMITVIGEVASMCNPDLVQRLIAENEHFYQLEYGE